VTLANIQATGSGRLRARVAIEGFTEFVSAADMVRAAGATTPARVHGLDIKSLRFGARGDLMRAKLSADSCDIKIFDIGGAATAVLGKRPQDVVYLSADLAVGGVTANVLDTSARPASGVIHIGTETCAYSGKTGTSFTGLTRGIYGTTAQAHYVATGARLAYPRVTDVPESLEGRRVLVYFYGDAESPTGDGTLVWRGIASTGASYDRGIWSFSVDPVTRLLDAQFGASLNEPVPIRGIYYPTTAPLLILLRNVGAGALAVVKLTGFYEDATALRDALTTQIAAAIATPRSGTWTWSAGSSITGSAPGPDGWGLTYFVGTGAGTVREIQVSIFSEVDGEHGYAPSQWREDDGIGSSRPLVGAGVAGRVYKITLITGVPRAVVGRHPRGEAGSDFLSATYASYESLAASDPTAGPDRIYLGGIVIPTVANTIITLAPTGDPDRDLVNLGVSGIDVTRYISTGTPPSFRKLGAAARVLFGQKIAQGTVADLRTALIADSPTLATTGAMPLITAGDILTLDVAEVVGDCPLASNRIFCAIGGLKLGEVIENELMVMGCYQRLNLGAIEWVRLHSAVATDAAAWTIVEADIDRSSWPQYARGGDGIVSGIEYKTGWNPTDNEWRGRSYFPRDVQAASGTSTSLTLEVAQRSYPASRTEDASIDDGVTPDLVAQMAMTVFGLFGAEYDKITVVVGMRFFGAKIGDTASLTSSRVPSTTGVMGVSGDTCLITGYSFDASTGRVSLELLRSGQQVAGYAPAFRVTAQANVGGNTWDVTVNLSDYTDATDVATWLRAGDLVRVTQGDSAAPTELNGTVVSASALVVRVTFVGAWAPGASEWALRTRDASAYAVTDRLAAFFFIGNTAARVPFSSSVPARVLSA